MQYARLLQYNNVGIKHGQEYNRVKVDPKR